MPGEDSGRKDIGDHNYANMARPALLLQTPADVDSGPNPDSPNEEPAAGTERGGAPPGGDKVNDASSLEGVRRNARNPSLSSTTKNLLKSKLSKGTRKTYSSPWNQWSSWCGEQQLDPVSAPVEAVANWLALYQQSHSYTAVNTARSAISCYHERVLDGNILIPVGQHDLIKDILDTTKKVNPPKPRYSTTWDVNKVLDYFRSLGANAGLDLKLLTQKAAMLLSLVLVTRGQELTVLRLSNMRTRDRDIIFEITDSTKTDLDQVIVKEYTTESYLDPVNCLQTYVTATQSSRSPEGLPDQLFLAMNQPHNPVKPCTIARWLTSVMESSGIDTSRYKAHSVRSASTSKAKTKGLSCSQVIKLAHWSNVGTFKTFYLKEIDTHAEEEVQEIYTNAVLS